LGDKLTLGKLLQELDDAGLDLRVQGFFNVESGGFGMGNAYFPYCDCVSDLFGDSDCRECERWFANYVSFHSGDGDGIYLAAAIINPAEPRKTLGLIAFFDYKYEMASYARQFIENEEVPDFPIDLAMQFEDALAYKHDSFLVKDTLLIGDKFFAYDNNYAVLDFPNPVSGKYTCMLYCEEVDPSIEATIERLEQTQGLNAAAAQQAIESGEASFEAVRESLGIQAGANPRPNFIARAVVALSPELSDLIEEDEFEIEDLDLVNAQFAYGSVVTSHRQQMTDSVIWQNAMLAREWDRAAGDVDDATAKILLFDLWTWLYQGRELGDTDCANYLENFKYQPTVEEQIYLLVRRGMYGAALLMSKE
jgi:hypothetical protein